MVEALLCYLVHNLTAANRQFPLQVAMMPFEVHEQGVHNQFSP